MERHRQKVFGASPGTCDRRSLMRINRDSVRGECGRRVGPARGAGGHKSEDLVFVSHSLTFLKQRFNLTLRFVC